MMQAVSYPNSGKQKGQCYQSNAENRRGKCLGKGTANQQNQIQTEPKGTHGRPEEPFVVDYPGDIHYE